MAESAELAQRVRRLLPECESSREVRMFGGLAFMRDDRMVVSVSGDGLLARIAPERDAELVVRPGARRAEMGKGRSVEIRGRTQVLDRCLPGLPCGALREGGCWIGGSPSRWHSVQRSIVGKACLIAVVVAEKGLIDHPAMVLCSLRALLEHGIEPGGETVGDISPAGSG